MALLDSGALLGFAAAILVLACFLSDTRRLRFGLILAGILAIADALLRDTGMLALFGGAALILANILMLLRLGGSGTLAEESREFYDRHLSGLSESKASLLIDQGSFIEARAGDILTREGAPVESLHFLVSGVAAVLVDDVIVGRIGPGELIGEAALLGDAHASATVRLAGDSNRLWFIPKDRLAAFLAVQPDIAARLNAATMTALRDKLERANRARAEN